ncbi:MAG: type II toxin-antitoxin system prevent-host-death family antitoxin [Thermomicrobiales bacterium]
MPGSEQATQTVDSKEASRCWDDLLDRVVHDKTRVMIADEGKPVAAIITAEELERFVRVETERAERFGALEATQAAFADLPDDQVEREVARALGAVREMQRRTESESPPL